MRSLPCRHVVALLLVALYASSAQAADVYKCTDAGGGLAFQDHECAAGSTQTVVHMNAPPPEAAAAPAGDDSAPPPPAPPPPPPADAPTPPPAPASMWVCTRPENDTQYISHDPNPPARLVPAGVMGVPGKSLGDAYGKNSDISVSAPGLRKTPVSTSPQDAAAADYVAVQDQCEPATSSERSCDFLRGEYEKLRQKWKHAFKSDEDALRVQLDQLDAQLDHC